MVPRPSVADQAEILTTWQEQRSVKKQKVRDAWFWLYFGLLLVFGLEVWLLFRSHLTPTIVTSSSMEPTLMQGDVLLIRRLRYSPDALPERGEIVFFRDPINQGDWMVKRVIGLPGERVSIRDGQVYINGVPLKEPYLKSLPLEGPEEWDLPEDCVFVLGDHRAVSYDSREFGPLPLDRIEGKVIFRYFPLNRIGLLPRPEFPVIKKSSITQHIPALP